MAFYEDDESDVAYGDCELCSKGDELSRCEVCSNRYCTDCFGGECCTGKSLCVNCVYVCKTCNDAYALKWKDVKALKDSHNIDASFCEGCAFECKSCRDTAGRPLYFCEEHAAEHNGACPGVSVAVARTAAAAHGEEKTSKALAAAQKASGGRQGRITCCDESRGRSAYCAHRRCGRPQGRWWRFERGRGGLKAQCFRHRASSRA